MFFPSSERIGKFVLERMLQIILCASKSALVSGELSTLYSTLKSALLYTLRISWPAALAASIATSVSNFSSISIRSDLTVKRI